MNKQSLNKVCKGVANKLMIYVFFIISGKCDDLTSPSSRLMLGQPCASGTGAFDVFLNMSSATKPMQTAL